MTGLHSMMHGNQGFTYASENNHGNQSFTYASENNLPTEIDLKPQFHSFSPHPY